MLLRVGSMAIGRLLDKAANFSLIVDPVNDTSTGMHGICTLEDIQISWTGARVNYVPVISAKKCKSERGLMIVDLLRSLH